MIILIHGDDITSSRNYFYQLKQQHAESTSFDGNSVTITDLTQELDGGGLFGDTKTIIIEHLLSKKKNTTEFKELLSYLLTHANDSTIILWENKPIEATTLKLLGNVTNKPFKLPQSLFVFLDGIKPNNGETLVKLFHQTLETVEEDAIFYMLIRHIRILLALKTPDGPAIDEVKRMTWQKAKLQKQASLFTDEQLLSIYKELFAIETAYKTGGIALTLTSSIDILLLNI